MWKTIIFIIFFGINSSILCQELSQYDNISPDTLFDNSVNSHSPAEKKIIRYYLSTKYPETKFGLCSKAYLLEESNVSELNEAMDLYRKCISEFPDFLYPYLRIADNTKDKDEKLEMYKKVLSIDPSFDDYMYIRYTYFTYLNDFNNRKDAENFLTDWQKKLNGNYIFNFIAARSIINSGQNFEEAENLLLKAIELNSENYDLYNELMRLRFDNLSNVYEENTDNAIAILVDWVKKLRLKNNHKELSQAYELIGDISTERFKGSDYAFQFYEMAFREYPTGEIVKKMDDLSDDLNFKLIEKKYDFFKYANRVLPNNEVILGSLAHRIYRDFYKIDSSEYYFKEAIKYSYTEMTRGSNSLNYAYYILEEDKMDFDQARDVYLKYSYKENLNKNTFYPFMIDNRIKAQEYDQALQILNEKEKLLKLENDINENWFIDKRKYINSLILNKNKNDFSKEPRLVFTSTLVTEGCFALSPDGTMFSTRSEIPEIWNLEKNVRIMKIGKGGVKRVFSPDSKKIGIECNYINSGGSHEYTFSVYDLKTGSVQCQLPFDSEITDFSWSPESKKIALIVNGYARIYNIEEKKFVANFRLSNVSINGELRWTSDGKYIITAQAQAKEVKVWDATTFELVNTLTDGVNWPHALSVNFANNLIFCADDKRTLHIWDISRNWEHRSLEISVLAGDIIASPVENKIIINDFGSSINKYGFMLINTDNGQVLTIVDSLKANEAAFSPNGKKIYRVNGNKIEILDPDNLSEVSALLPMSNEPEVVNIDYKEKYLLTGDKQGVYVWDIMNGKKIHSWMGEVEFLENLGRNTSKFIGVDNDPVNKVSSVYKYDSFNFTKIELFKIGYRVQKIYCDSLNIVFAGKEYTENDRGQKDGKIYVFNIPSNKFIAKLESIQLVTDALYYGEVYKTGFTDIDYNPKEKEVMYSTYWQDGFGRKRIYSKKAKILNVFTGKEIKTLSVNNREIKKCRFDSPDNSNIKLTTNWWSFYFEKNKSTYFKVTDERAYEHVIQLTPSSYISWSDDFIRVVDSISQDIVKNIYIDENIIGAYVLEDDNILLTINGSNEISYYNLSNFDNELNILSRINGEWLSYSKRGEFYCSINGDQNAYWYYDTVFLPLSFFRNKYENKFLISNTISRIAQKIDTVLVPALENYKEVFTKSYQMVLEDTASLSSKEKYTLKFQIIKNDIRDSIPDLEFSQQGQVLNYEEKIKGLTIKSKGDNIFLVEKEFDIVEGKNYLQASIKSSDITVERENIVVNKSEISKEPRKIFYLGIGVKEYENSRQNLDFADSDITEVKDALMKKQNSQYRVIPKILLNDNATNENIIKKLNEIKKESTKDDVVFINISGHGCTSKDQKLWFMSYHGIISNPESGFSMDTLKNFVFNRTPGQKVFICLDLCHAGAFLYNTDTKFRMSNEEAAVDLSKGSGLIVFASSSGKDNSLENLSYCGGHGAFACALIEALNGKADIKLPRDGQVSIWEIIGCVPEHVQELTSWKQRPIVPCMFDFTDYNICQYK